MSYEQYNFISQIFTVQDSTGIYLTSADLFFSDKDESLPVTIQIREVLQGTPSNVIIPFSQVTLKTEDVNTSDDASVATKFTFESPVYLAGPSQIDQRGNAEISRVSREYALCILSNSNNYSLYSASIGNLDQNQNSNSSNLPFVRSLFKPKTSSTWDPSEDEVLKFFLFRASFESQGIVRLFNPILESTSHEAIVQPNSFLTLSKKVIVGLNSANYTESEIQKGVTIVQGSSSGKLVGFAGSISDVAGVGVTILNAGAGYTSGTYTSVSLQSTTGLGQDAEATIGVITTGISTVTITNGGFGYAVGDVLTIGDISGNAGFGAQLGVTSITENNSLIIDNVQGGLFAVGITTLQYINSSGVTTSVGVGSDITVSSLYEDPLNDGLHMKVNHENHDMNSFENYVRINKFYPPKTETHSKTTVELSPTDNLQIELESSSGFETFEGVTVDGSNPGYVLVGNEIISYTGVSGNNLTGITRKVDSLSISAGVKVDTVSIYPIGTYVYKYQLKGVSLRRINKVHKLSEVSNVDSHPINIDSYYIKIETSSTDFDGNTVGTDKTDTLFFNQTSLVGDGGEHLTQNIQFANISPSIKNIKPTSTSIQGRVRTFSATSSNGTENSFEDLGYSDISINGTTLFDSPRLVASMVNESRNITNSPGNRSFDMELLLSTEDERVSPLIDLDEVSVNLGSYRLNQPIPLTSYATDDSVRSSEDDGHACAYVSKPVYLNFPSNSLKVLLSARTGKSGNIRVLYKLFNSNNLELSSNYELFPGYKNYTIDSSGIRRVTDPSNNDGTSDYFVDGGSYDTISEYEYTIDDLPNFNAFSIKVIMSGTNQADPPILNDVRAIATVKPEV